MSKTVNVRTAELQGAALDYCVAITEGYECQFDDEVSGPWLVPAEGYLHDEKPLGRFKPSTDWGQGGPLIEEHAITVLRCDDDWGEDDEGFCTNERIPVWCAVKGQHSIQSSTEHQQHEAMYQVYEDEALYGPTPLVAAMRCLVASKLGATVSTPVGLLP